MVIRQKLTPEAFLSAPRRGPAVPSPSGELAFFTVSTHTFGEGTKKEVMLMELDTGVQWPISEDDKVSDIKWIPGSQDQLAWLRPGDEGQTEVAVVAASSEKESEPDSYVAATIPASVSAWKLKQLKDGSIAVAIVALSGKNGELYNEETAEKKASSVRVYKTYRVREVRAWR